MSSYHNYSVCNQSVSLFMRISSLTFGGVFLPCLMLTTSIGVICNAICIYIFTFSNNMNTKFLQLLNFYSFNSFLYNLNDLFLIIISIRNFDSIYQTTDAIKIYSTRYKFLFYVGHIYFTIRSVVFTFGGINFSFYFLNFCF